MDPSHNFCYTYLYCSNSARKKFVLKELPNSSETEDMRKVR